MTPLSQKRKLRFRAIGSHLLHVICSKYFRWIILFNLYNNQRVGSTVAPSYSEEAEAQRGGVASQGSTPGMELGLNLGLSESHALHAPSRPVLPASVNAYPCLYSPWGF